MDLIGTDYIWREKEVITDGVFDLAYGADENDFKLTVDQKIPDLTGGSLLYIAGTEYGGVVDKIGYSDSQGTVFYEGRSWSGVLDSKIILPNEVQETARNTGYAIPEGTLFSTAITNLLTFMGVLTENTSTRTLDDGTSLTHDWTFLLRIDDSIKNIPVVNNYVDPNESSPDDPNQEFKTLYMFDEFVTGYKGISDFIRAHGITLGFSMSYITVNNKKIVNPVLEFKPIIDYTTMEEFDKETLPIEGAHLLNKTNHLIGLGNRIDNAQTRVNIHIYLKANGDLTTDVNEWGFSGVNEIARVEEFGQVQDEECRRKAMKKMKEIIEEDDFKLTLYAEHPYQIGDIVGRRDELMFGSEWIKQQITKKIVKLDGQDMTIDYEMGGVK
jgi:hypothetical protein